MASVTHQALLMVSAAPVAIAGVTGLVAWYDASVAAGFTLSGSDIVSLADQSGNGYTMGFSGVKPTYSATSFNSRPGMTFAAANSALSCDNVAFGTGNTLTVALVGEFTVSSGDYGRAVSYTKNPPGGAINDANNNGSWLLSRESTTTSAVLYRNASIAHAVAGYTTNRRIIGTIKSDGVMTIYMDGVATTGSTLNAAFASPGQLVLGNVLSATNSAWNGVIAEVIVANGFSDATAVSTLDTNLKAKWGL